MAERITFDTTDGKPTFQKAMALSTPQTGPSGEDKNSGLVSKPQPSQN